ncbi:hypothetical protein JB92DRAFT_1142307 [Gautieria morchelliformis]|nr:hypothetical protein JB92DRAFT_1142307 [Gautieria morchelliformis]
MGMAAEREGMRGEGMKETVNTSAHSRPDDIRAWVHEYAARVRDQCDHPRHPGHSLPVLGTNTEVPLQATVHWGQLGRSERGSSRTDQDDARQWERTSDSRRIDKLEPEWRASKTKGGEQEGGGCIPWGAFSFMLLFAFLSCPHGPFCVSFVSLFGFSLRCVSYSDVPLSRRDRLALRKTALGWVWAACTCNNEIWQVNSMSDTFQIATPSYRHDPPTTNNRSHRR